jgi:hypothetical protein
LSIPGAGSEGEQDLARDSLATLVQEPFIQGNKTIASMKAHEERPCNQTPLDILIKAQLILEINLDNH